MKTTILYAIMGFGFGVLAAPAPSAEPATAGQALQARTGEYLGGIDVNYICRVQYGAAYHAEARGGTCNDWGCTRGDGVYKGLDTPRACSLQYGLTTYAYCSSGINGWGCYRA